MAVPRNRLSNARKNIRRAHDAKKPKNLLSCKNCGASKRPHAICSSCGMYRGRAVIAQAAEQE